jgi:hypothetical protein
MSAATEFFCQQLAIHARSMKLHDAVIFLRGALESTGENPEMVEVKRAHEALVLADDQLEVLGGQMRLNFGKDGQ